jgi:FixJ family two-component response regulator
VATTDNRLSREDAEQQLASVARKRRRRLAALQEVDRERDALILDAIAAGVPRKTIGKLVDLSEQRIYQIRLETLDS